MAHNVHVHVQRSMVWCRGSPSYLVCIVLHARTGRIGRVFCTGDTPPPLPPPMVLLQALAKRQQANVTRDRNAVVSLEILADEFKAGHVAILGDDAKARLKNYTGFVQYIATKPDLTVILFSAEAIDLLATTMAMGLCTTWYVDATGNLVSPPYVCPAKRKHLIFHLWGSQATAHDGPGGEKVPIFHTAFATRHPAAFLNPTLTSQVPGGPLFCMVQSTDRTEGAVLLPTTKLMDALERLGGDKLLEARPQHGTHPSVVITDNDRSLQNGMCRALHGLRLVNEVWLFGHCQPTKWVCVCVHVADSLST